MSWRRQCGGESDHGIGVDTGVDLALVLALVLVSELVLMLVLALVVFVNFVAFGVDFVDFGIGVDSGFGVDDQSELMLMLTLMLVLAHWDRTQGTGRHQNRDSIPWDLACQRETGSKPSPPSTPAWKSQKFKRCLWALHRHCAGLKQELHTGTHHPEQDKRANPAPRPPAAPAEQLLISAVCAPAENNHL